MNAGTNGLKQRDTWITWMPEVQALERLLDKVADTVTSRTLPIASIPTQFPINIEKIATSYLHIPRAPDWRYFMDRGGNAIYAAPSGDIWEVVGGPYPGMQYFTLLAAEREAWRIGKVPIQDIDIQQVLTALGHPVQYTNLWQSDHIIAAILHLIPAGFYDPLTERLYCQWSTGHVWIDGPNPEESHSLSIATELVNPYMPSSSHIGFCVLCRD